MTDQDLAESRQLLRGVVGSTALGCHLLGTDDSDQLGICWEPPEAVIGFQKFEQWTSRSQPEGVRSQPGDLDLCVYSLRKYCSLALKGNPSILMLLFLPEYLIKQPWGTALIANRECFYSIHAAKSFYGYMMAQAERLAGMRGGKDCTRPELVKKYGYDVKYAYHVLRLGIQGVEYCDEHVIHLPMREQHIELLLAVRTGKWSLPKVLTYAHTLSTQLEDIIKKNAMPEKPEMNKIEWLVMDCYRERWDYTYQ